jgi:hypothetical protein
VLFILYAVGLLEARFSLRIEDEEEPRSGRN